MIITFKNRKLKKIFNSETELYKKYGKENGRIIMRRMMVLKSALSLNEVATRKPDRRHELKGKKHGQFAVYLKHPFRLIFKPNYDPLPLKANGEIDFENIKSIKILSVEDYH